MLEHNKMMPNDKELPQEAWGFGGTNRAKPTPWLSNTLSELDDKTKQMLNLIGQDADSFAQRAEAYYKKRPILVDMLGDLYRAHRSLAEQYDHLLKHSRGGTRHRAFGPSSCARSQSPQPLCTSGEGSPTASSSCSDSVSAYDSEESEVDDPEQDENEEVSGIEAGSTEPSQNEEQQVEVLRAELARLKEQNAALRKVAEENAALRTELAGKDEEKREVIRQLAASFSVVREENRALRGRVRESKGSSSLRMRV